MNKITILIADDHKLIRETWAYILNSDPQISGTSLPVEMQRKPLSWQE